MDLAASVYQNTSINVSVNGMNPLSQQAGGMDTRASVVSFLTYLRSDDGINCKKMSFDVTKVAQDADGVWFHEDVWSCTAGVGTCRATWRQIDAGDWAIMTDEITFTPQPSETLTLDVVKQRMHGVFEKEFNRGHFGSAASVYAAGDEALDVTVEGGSRLSGDATNQAQVASFLGNLAKAGCKNMQFTSISLKKDGDGAVVANQHVDTWKCDLGTGTCTATWEQDEEGNWAIVKDVITFDYGQGHLMRELDGTPDSPRVRWGFVADKMKNVFEVSYNAGDFGEAASLYKEDGISVSVNGNNPLTDEAGAMETQTDVATFLGGLHSEAYGCTDMVFNITDVYHNIHEDVWSCATGWGQCTAKWDKGKIVSDKITFTPKTSTALTRDIVMQKMKAIFEFNYNRGRMGLAASVYRNSSIHVSVNGQNPLSQEEGAMDNRGDVSSFLNYLYSDEGINCKKMSFDVTQVGQDADGAWFHEDVWSCTAGVGTCRATWQQVDTGDWHILTDAITFTPQPSETLTLDVVKHTMKAVFEKEFNRGRFGWAASVYAAGNDALDVTVDGGSSMSGEATNSIEVASFLSKLSKAGCNNMQFTSHGRMDDLDDVIENIGLMTWARHQTMEPAIHVSVKNTFLSAEPASPSRMLRASSEPPSLSDEGKQQAQQHTDADFTLKC